MSAAKYTITVADSHENFGILVLAELVAQNGFQVEVKRGDGLKLELSSGKGESFSCDVNTTIARTLAEAASKSNLYVGGHTDAIVNLQIENWLRFAFVHLQSDAKSGTGSLLKAVRLVADALAGSFLVADRLTLADVAIWSSLDVLESNGSLASAKQVTNFDRITSFLQRIASQSVLTKAIEAAKKRRNEMASQLSVVSRFEEGGRFASLPNAVRGQVVVRFPPEASGYLHIGHAKAALLNEHYKELFEGRLILRFDDTNPDKETSEFEEAILHDLELINVHYNSRSRTSDHFDKLLGFAEQLIKAGLAYCDDTDTETMRKEREARIESRCRGKSVQENLAIWKDMVAGKQDALRYCVRARIDMQSLNGCMRDPTIYRCKLEPHVTTGTRYKVYPTYDFACPIVDSIEGVTHALRTSEYHDRDEQFYWFIQALGLRRPEIYEYSRLNLQYTVLSKRKLTWFVDQGIVDGWDDPRFPTVRGMLRRGLTADALKQFIIAQGSSRSVVTMEWDKIWAYNKKTIDPVAPRYTALKADNLVPMHIDGVSKREKKDVDAHPKNSQVGKKPIWYSNVVRIEQEDAKQFEEGKCVTLMNWGNVLVSKVTRDASGLVTRVDGKLQLENTDFKNTLKVTWLADVDSEELATPVTVITYGNILTKPVLGKDDDFKAFVNKDSKRTERFVGDHVLKTLKKGAIIQLQRRGFYIVDRPFAEPSLHTAIPQPVELIYIPDGRKEGEQETGATAATNAKVNEAKGKENGPAKEKRPANVSNNQDAKENKPPAAANVDRAALDKRIQDQGEKVRSLKSANADKAAVKAEVDALLKLKNEFKTAFGEDWKPAAAAPAAPAAVSAPVKSNAPSRTDLDARIRQVGDKIRDLKSKKADKATLQPEIDALLKLKQEFKAAFGEEWKPEAVVAAPATTAAASAPAASAKGPNRAELDAQIRQVGDKIRDLKSKKADKATLQPEIDALLKLKQEFKAAFGEEWKPEADAKDTKAKKEEPKKEAAKPAEQKAGKPKNQKADAADEDDEKGTKTRLGLEARKAESFSDWYTQVITKAELIEYYDVSGCYILRPWSYAIWERIRDWFDAEIKKLGVDNAYFPLFVTAAALEKEKTHIADFAPEVAWVTRSGKSDLPEPIAVRPTSETIMYPAFAKWIRSHRDLPLKVNQWNNVVRWEFKDPQPFLRTREFLWQEGHTVFAEKKEAMEEVYAILDLYSQVYEKLLAVPVVRGKKTEKEKFAGGDVTTTCEVYIPVSGRGSQACTSHHLGQNFSKMFDIMFEHPETHERVYAYQNSWGITTRSIGIITMVHGDDRGMILPPRIAMYQMVIVPCGITAKSSDADRESLLNKCYALRDRLKQAGIRVNLDARDRYTPGWKYNYWELKGVPLRIELGPRDVKAGQIVCVRRDTGDRSTLNDNDTLVQQLNDLLENIQSSLYTKAKAELDDHVKKVYTFADFCAALEKKCFCLSPFCGDKDCEGQIKEESGRQAKQLEGEASMGAKSLCIPFDQPEPIDPSTTKLKCINPACSLKPQYYTLFGRSY